jgi:hypothetical protein
VNDGHDAFPQPLLGDPGLSETGEAEAIPTNEMPSVEDVLSDGRMGEAAGIPEKLASSRREQ